MTLKSRFGGQRGVSLVELLMAIGMSTLVIGMALALFKDMGFAARLTQDRRDAGFQARAFFGGLSRNIMTGGGILGIGPGRLELLNVRNRRVEYLLTDSVLTVNGHAWGFRVASLDIEPWGPMRPEKDGGFSVPEPWDLDSLDGNRDGTLDFSELDRDRSGDLDPEEVRYLSRIRLTLTIIDRGLPLTQTCIVHPRNRLPAVKGRTAEEIMEEGGIPEL